MSCPFNDEQLMQLQVFIELCKTQPQIIHHPRLSFFKDYLVSLGVTLPTATFGTKHFTPSGDGGQTEAGEKAQSSSEEETESESDVELDMDGVVEGDTIGSDQLMGDCDKEPSDEDRDQSDEKRSEAMRAFSNQQFEEAIKFYTEAIQLNPQSALLFAKRGQVYLKLNKPNACINDCTRALELNCDSAAAYKFRGRAYRLLGKFEEASHDLCESLKIDYDDQTNEWLNDVKPNAEKLRQHKLSVQRKKEEKEHGEKLRRVRKAQEARSNAAKAQAKANAQSAPTGGMGGGMPGAGPFPQGFAANDLGSLLMDPEIITAFQDPEVMAAFQDLSTNPANFAKYQSNPKIAAAIQKLQTKLGKGGSMPFGGGAGVNKKEKMVMQARDKNYKPIAKKQDCHGHAFGKGATDDDVGLD